MSNATHLEGAPARRVTRSRAVASCVHLGVPGSGAFATVSWSRERGVRAWAPPADTPIRSFTSAFSWIATPTVPPSSSSASLRRFTFRSRARHVDLGFTSFRRSSRSNSLSNIERDEESTDSSTPTPPISASWVRRRAARRAITGEVLFPDRPFPAASMFPSLPSARRSAEAAPRWNRSPD